MLGTDEVYSSWLCPGHPPALGWVLRAMAMARTQAWPSRAWESWRRVPRGQGSGWCHVAWTACGCLWAGGCGNGVAWALEPWTPDVAQALQPRCGPLEVQEQLRLLSRLRF